MNLLMLLPSFTPINNTSLADGPTSAAVVNPTPDLVVSKPQRKRRRGGDDVDSCGGESVRQGAGRAIRYSRAKKIHSSIETDPKQKTTTSQPILPGSSATVSRPVGPTAAELQQTAQATLPEALSAQETLAQLTYIHELRAIFSAGYRFSNLPAQMPDDLMPFPIAGHDLSIGMKVRIQELISNKQKTTRYEKVWLHVDIRRPLVVRDEFVGKRLDGKRFKRAVLVYMGGAEQARPCGLCKSMRGPFRQCVVADIMRANLGGCCANCVYCENPKGCEYHPKAKPGVERWLATPNHPPTRTSTPASSQTIAPESRTSSLSPAPTTPHGQSTSPLHVRSTPSSANAMDLIPSTPPSSMAGEMVGIFQPLAFRGRPSSPSPQISTFKHPQALPSLGLSANVDGGESSHHPRLSPPGTLSRLFVSEDREDDPDLSMSSSPTFMSRLSRFAMSHPSRGLPMSPFSATGPFMSGGLGSPPQQTLHSSSDSLFVSPFGTPLLPTRRSSQGQSAPPKSAPLNCTPHPKDLATNTMPSSPPQRATEEFSNSSQISPAKLRQAFKHPGCNANSVICVEPGVTYDTKTPSDSSRAEGYVDSTKRFSEISLPTTEEVRYIVGRSSCFYTQMFEDGWQTWIRHRERFGKANEYASRESHTRWYYERLNEAVSRYCPGPPPNKDAPILIE